MPASTISPEIRAAAIADLLSGDPPAEVAARYRLDRDLVNKWKQRYVGRAADTDTDMSATGADMSVSADTDLPIPTLATEHTIGGLLLELLAAKLQASQAIAKAAQSPAWLERQSAADLATLGEYLDRSAFALGDRLATAAQQQRADAEE